MPLYPRFSHNLQVQQQDISLRLLDRVVLNMIVFEVSIVTHSIFHIVLFEEKWSRHILTQRSPVVLHRLLKPDIKGVRHQVMTD